MRHVGDTLYFSVQDRAGETAVPLSYTGTVPDPFREGREVIVTVEKQGDSYVGERNSLITKCPSKYTVTPSKTTRSCGRAARDGLPLMAQLGGACLILALAGVLVWHRRFALRGQDRAEQWSESGRRSVYALAGILTVAFAVLELAFLRNDFAFNTVADTSSVTTPTFYKAAAVWSSQEGSLLLWAWLLSLWSTLVLFLTRKRMRDVQRLRDRDPARLRRFLHRADGVLRDAVRHHRPGAGGRRGP